MYWEEFLRFQNIDRAAIAANMNIFIRDIDTLGPAAEISTMLVNCIS